MQLRSSRDSRWPRKVAAPIALHMETSELADAMTRLFLVSEMVAARLPPSTLTLGDPFISRTPYNCKSPLEWEPIDRLPERKNWPPARRMRSASGSAEPH